MHSVLNERSVKAFRLMVEEETNIVLEGFMTSPEEFVKHFKRYGLCDLHFHVE